LIDAEADRHLWAERFDSDISELFALQDEVTSRIAVALNLELINAALARQPEHPGALDYIFRGRAVLFKPPTRESYLRRSTFSSAPSRSTRDPPRRGAGCRVCSPAARSRG
jgi:adenylate cyclase